MRLVCKLCAGHGLHLSIGCSFVNSLSMCSSLLYSSSASMPAVLDKRPTRLLDDDGVSTVGGPSGTNTGADVDAVEVDAIFEMDTSMADSPIDCDDAPLCFGACEDIYVELRQVSKQRLCRSVPNVFNGCLILEYTIPINTTSLLLAIRLAGRFRILTLLRSGLFASPRPAQVPRL